MRYKRGILVTSPPDLLYFEDMNGDGKADHREVVLTGFARTNPQHAVNHPVYGLDNWIYLAHSGGSEPVIYRDLFGDKGTRPHAFPTGRSSQGLDARGRGVRLKPDLWKVEGLSSRTQFGNAFDVYGHFFAHNNSIHAAARGDRGAVSRAQSAPAAAERDGRHLRPRQRQHHADHARRAVRPADRGRAVHLGVRRSRIYAGGALPGGLRRRGVRRRAGAQPRAPRRRSSPKGSTFVASRGRRDMEFLASTDSWFRPVNLYVGPDGALYVIDYYRPYIEHPEWGSSDLQKNPERALHRQGSRTHLPRRRDDGGRAAATPRPGAPRLGSASDARARRGAGASQLWWRRTAQRLLVHRQPARRAPALERLADARPSALARLHALWTLDGLGRLEMPRVLQALADPDAGVRENAIVLAERWLTQPQVGAALLALANDPDARVRFQLLATLGSLDTPASHAAQERLLLGAIEDEWMQVAALSASSDRAAAWFERALQPGSGLTARRVTRPARGFFDRLGGVLAARQKAAELARAIADRHRPVGARRRLVAGGAARGRGSRHHRARGDRRRLGEQPGHAADAGHGRPAATPACGGDAARRRAGSSQAPRRRRRSRAPRSPRPIPQRPPTRASMPSRCWRWRMPQPHQPMFESVDRQHRARRRADCRRQRPGTGAWHRPAGLPPREVADADAAGPQRRGHVILARREGSQAMLDALQSGRREDRGCSTSGRSAA